MTIQDLNDRLVRPIQTARAANFSAVCRFGNHFYVAYLWISEDMTRWTLASFPALLGFGTA